MILQLCDRFKALPSQVRGEDAGILRMIKMEALARTEVSPGGQ